MCFMHLKVVLKTVPDALHSNEGCCVISHASIATVVWMPDFPSLCTN